LVTTKQQPSPVEVKNDVTLFLGEQFPFGSYCVFFILGSIVVAAGATSSTAGEALWLVRKKRRWEIGDEEREKTILISPPAPSPQRGPELPIISSSSVSEAKKSTALISAGVDVAALACGTHRSDYGSDVDAII